MPKSRVRVYMACSLDGYIAGENDDLSFLGEPGPENSLVADPKALGFEGFMSQVGAMLMGRHTFDVVNAMGGDWPYGETPVLVATTRELQAGPTIQPAAGTIEELITRATALAGDKDVYLDGGNLIRQALNAGLVDEMCLTLAPIILGSGIRLFDGLNSSTKVEFVSHHTYEQGMMQIVVRPRVPLGRDD